MGCHVCGCDVRDVCAVCNISGSDVDKVNRHVAVGPEPRGIPFGSNWPMTSIISYYF